MMNEHFTKEELDRFEANKWRSDNNPKRSETDCKFCFGRGRWIDWNAGNKPVQCEKCEGTGKMSDKKWKITPAADGFYNEWDEEQIILDSEGEQFLNDLEATMQRSRDSFHKEQAARILLEKELAEARGFLFRFESILKEEVEDKEVVLRVMKRVFEG